MKTISIGRKWEEAGGRPAGFDFLRVVLAIAVILWHTILIDYGRPAEFWYWTGPLRPFSVLLVPGFFAMSGFLVAASLERNDIPSFLVLRALRIFPALAVEVVVSALIIGPAFTTFRLTDYFSDPMFKQYFLNATGNIHYQLPGVFLDLPAGRVVDLQLWTTPCEIQYYILLSLAAVFGLTKQLKRFAALIGILLLSKTLQQLATHTLPLMTFNAPGILMFSFFFGVLFFLMRDRVPLSLPYFLMSLLLCSALVYFPAGFYLASFPFTYAIVYIGVSRFNFYPVSLLANYSYGVYLYGFPIQQAVSAILPGYRVWYINFALSFPLALLLAMVSWHCVESKIKNRKKAIINFIRRWRRVPGNEV